MFWSNFMYFGSAAVWVIDPGILLSWIPAILLSGEWWSDILSRIHMIIVRFKTLLSGSHSKMQKMQKMKGNATTDSMYAIRRRTWYFPLLKITYALSFHGSKMIQDCPNYFGWVPTVFDWPNLFWSGSNHFGQVWIIKIGPEKSDLNLTKMI